MDDSGVYCIAIHENIWDEQDCATAGGHYNPTLELHGDMNGTPSHAGDLEPFFFISPDPTQYSVSADKPTMFG